MVRERIGAVGGQSVRVGVSEGGREGAAVGEIGCEWSEHKGERPPARGRGGRRR